MLVLRAVSSVIAVNDLPIQLVSTFFMCWRGFSLRESPLNFIAGNSRKFFYSICPFFHLQLYNIDLPIKCKVADGADTVHLRIICKEKHNIC